MRFLQSDTFKNHDGAASAIPTHAQYTCSMKILFQMFKYFIILPFSLGY